MLNKKNGVACSTKNQYKFSRKPNEEEKYTLLLLTKSKILLLNVKKEQMKQTNKRNPVTNELKNKPTFLHYVYCFLFQKKYITLR